MTMRLPLITLFILSATSTAGYAQSWRCTFPDFKEPLTFIEIGNRTGKIVGNTGVSDVIVFKGPEVVSFVEEVPSGAVMTTTIFTPTGEAVHSRNTVMSFTGSGEPPFMVSQRMGKCIPVD